MPNETAWRGDATGQGFAAGTVGETDVIMDAKPRAEWEEAPPAGQVAEKPPSTQMSWPVT